ncbi:Gyltl1b [Symbiodinium pilosum]|uniref:Gyltl1b protein n=1 Tax=Symbiodinium pilosum TaxID=2952 RepID=A0A812LQN2_SYMPI|nr:Gyltl1b [Symbiodinium pilosum]
MDEVPLRGSAVGEIMKYHYTEPALFAEPFEVTVPKTWVDDMSTLNVKPVVPTEHLVAFILLLAGICTMEVLLHGC